jgi:hypothetical protein
MSRGYGLSQREVLAALEDGRWHQLADGKYADYIPSVAGTGASRARIESLRRAIKTLEAAGRIETDYVNGELCRQGSRLGTLISRKR